MNRPGESKPSFSFAPPRAVLELLRVLEAGSNKHGFDNWRVHAPELFRDATMRHALEHQTGQRHDGDTGLLTSAHMAASSLILVEHDLIALEGDEGKIDWDRLMRDRGETS